MAQNIYDLPEGIKKLALKRSAPNSGTTDSTGNLANAFIWSLTPEGPEFWGKINDGDYQVFYDKYPNAKLPASFYNDLCAAIIELQKAKELVTPYTATEPAVTPVQPAGSTKEAFINGETVFVPDGVDDWIEGVFIGMLGSFYVVNTKGSNIDGFVNCKKTSQIIIHN